MEKFYFKPLWAAPGLSNFYRYYNEQERRESTEMYCSIDRSVAFDDVHYIAEAQFLIDGVIHHFYASPHEHVLQNLSCTYEPTCERDSGIYRLAGVYGRVIIMRRSFNAGQTVWRVTPPDDGGDWVPQMLIVCENSSELMVECSLNGTAISCKSSDLYTDKLSCAKECWERSGKEDAFVQLCMRNGIVSKDARKEELSRQMDIWGARTYDELLESLI